MIGLIIVVLLVKMLECDTDIYSQLENQLSLYPRTSYYQEVVGNKDTIKPCNAFNCATCYYDTTDTKVKCFNCLDGFYMNSQFECKPCLDQEIGSEKLCAKCIGGKLTDCYETISQYYFDMYDAGENADGTKIKKITKCPQVDVNAQMIGCKECLYCYDCELPNKKKKMGCSECDTNYVLDQDTNECVAINDINCEEFYAEDIYSCKKCKEGFSTSSLMSTITNKNQLFCEECLVDKCKSCNTQDPYTCLQCQNGYFLEPVIPVPTDTKTAKSKCLIFRDTVNDVNNNKVVYDTKGDYTEDDTNIICNSPYFIQKNKFCLSCNTGYSKIKVGNENQSCGNLLSCKKIMSQVVNEQKNDFMNCLECNDGYLRYSVSSYSYKLKGRIDPVLVNQKIGRCSTYEDTKNSTNQIMYVGSQTCPEGCKTCVYDSSIVMISIKCESCYDNYYLNTDTKQCVRCQANCQTCSSSTVCVKCYAPYHSDLNNQCVLCKTGCAECYIPKTVDQQQQICQKCMLGYHHQIKQGSTNQCLLDGTNFKCDPLAGQLRHFSSRSNQCFDCAVNKCAKCVNFRYSCSTCDNQMYSLTQPFYWKGLVQEATVCRSANTNLAYCQYGTNEQCIVCNLDSRDPDAGKTYRFDIQQFRCLKNCNVGQYEVRKEGNSADGTLYYQDMCITCMDNCKQCSYNANTRFPECQICNKGYYLLLGQCQPCPPQCTECKSEVFCTSCQSEFKTHQNFILNIRFCGKDETGYVPNTDRYLSSVDYVPCIENCNDVCAPGYYAGYKNVVENINDDKCYDQCPYKYIEDVDNARCIKNPTIKTVQILPTIKEFSPFTQRVFSLENSCSQVTSQQWTVSKFNTVTNQYENFKLIDTVDDVYKLIKLSISGNNLDPSSKYKLKVEAECLIYNIDEFIPSIAKFSDEIEFSRSDNYYNSGQLSIKGVDQGIVNNAKFQLSLLTSDDSFTMQYSQFNKNFYEIILYYVKIFSGTVDPNFNYTKIYDTNDNQNMTIDKILYSEYFQTNDQEIQYKLPPLHGFEELGDLYIEFKMAGYRQYGGYVKYSKFKFQTKNNPTLFIDQYKKDTKEVTDINRDFKSFYLYLMTKYWEQKHRFSKLDNDNKGLSKDDSYLLSTSTYDQLSKENQTLTNSNARMGINTMMHVTMIYKQMMSYTELLNSQLFTQNMDLISSMYYSNKTNDIDQMTFQDFFEFYQLILANFQKVTKDENNRVSLYNMQQDQIIKIILGLIRTNQNIYQIQLFQVGSSKSIICLSSLLFNAQQQKSYDGVTLKSPKICENNQNTDSSNQVNKFQSQSQIIFPLLSYLDSIDDKTVSQFQALLMNANSNIFINIQNDAKQLLESAIVFVGLYNLTGQKNVELPTDFYQQLVNVRVPVNLGIDQMIREMKKCVYFKPQINESSFEWEVRGCSFYRREGNYFILNVLRFGYFSVVGNVIKGGLGSNGIVLASQILSFLLIFVILYQ